jgi:hypothetical protein
MNKVLKRQVKLGMIYLLTSLQVFLLKQKKISYLNEKFSVIL